MAKQVRRTGALIGGWVAAALFGLGLAGAQPAAAAGKISDANACVQHAAEAEQALDIPRGLLLAIALVESGQDGIPHPYAMSVNGRAVSARNVSDASRHLKDRRGQMRGNVYVGCMQLSLAHHRSQFQPAEAIVEPKQNVWYAARLLVRLHTDEGSWKSAVARYNGGSTRQARNYVCKVWQNLNELDTRSARLLESAGCDDSGNGSVTPATRRSYRNAQQVAAID